MAPDRGGPTTAVLLCGHLRRLGHGLDLHNLRRRLETLPGVRARIVENLCRQPRRVGSALEPGDARLVLGLCSGAYPVPELQAQLRKLGLDPLGVEVVDLGSYAARVHPRPVATDKAALLLAAAVAKACSFPGSRPENVKPVFPRQISRRTLFTLAFLEYRPVPSVDAARCRAAQGCRRCVETCPHDALTLASRRVELDRLRCTSCGLCVPACPEEAVEFPSAAPAQLEAQVAALIDSDAGAVQPRAILFTCPNGAAALRDLAERGRPLHPGWLPVELPCLGMLGPSWILAPLVMGAAAVALLPCEEARCRSGRRDALEGAVDYSRALLRSLGLPSGRIRLLPGGGPDLESALRDQPEPDGAARPAAPPAPFGFAARAAVLLALAEAANGGDGWVLRHPHSPFGLIEVASGCTGCGSCAAVCPAQALVLEADGNSLSLRFDAARCTACELCLPACPETGVIRLERVTDPRRLRAGPTVVHRDTYRSCARCGQPIAPEGMLRRLLAALGPGDEGTAAIISRYCMNCRQRSLGG